ncbi:ABC transporter substrate-binding protein [Aliiruegeria lutimaris]|uniref:Iron complex transport system substrate-binding protein n=1 Tax=Aliiruegeria lutimaris TaxID=571298 RepID=A0A1G9AK99_9RHOB|nr:ABC transporter substrate-binding protein [Aliiruegeria lutimaris]SDK27762.1 iron complex transport system substrate-binding protein [Aliiruegeria lutimaris]
MRHPFLIAICLGLALLGAGDGQAAPERVVSINLCTDQLALMLAAPGQLASVSRLSQDARSSSMAELARTLPANSVRAEEVFLYNPDLVLAGTFTDLATLSMLRRLGVRVEVIAPAYSLEDVRTKVTQMGGLLGREAEAAALVAEFDKGLAALEQPNGKRPRAAIYEARGYSAGPDSLSGAILAAAGFDNVATETGLTVGGVIALERLVMLEPELVVLPTTWPGASRAEEILQHSALRELQRQAGTAPLTDRDWICGTPHVLRAIGGLAQPRTQLGGAE